VTAVTELERARAQAAEDADFMPDLWPDPEWYTELADRDVRSRT
jgi:hypothetical protein